MLVGHGPNSAEDYAAWMHNLRVVADSVRRISGFCDVRVELVHEDAPAAVRAEAVQRLRDLVALQAEMTGQPVAVLPILISRGGISPSRVMQDSPKSRNSRRCVAGRGLVTLLHNSAARPQENCKTQTGSRASRVT